MNDKQLQITERIAEKLEKLFVNRDDAYAEAYLNQGSGRMSYGKKEGLFDKNLIFSHVSGEKTFGAYQLKENLVKWGCADFDLDTKEDFENALKLYVTLKSAGFHPLLEKSGGGEFKVHVWLFSNCEAKDMFYFLKNFCEQINIIPHEIFPKQLKTNEYGNLVKIPLGLHLVSQKRSYLLDDEFNEILDFTSIDKKLGYHLNNLDKIPKAVIPDKKISDSKTIKTNANDFDNFFNAILSINLPDGKSATEKKYLKITGVNDNILKNEAIWFFQKGYTLEKLEQEIKPIFQKNKWAFGDLKGWFKKTENKEINLINAGELWEYANTYYPELCALIPDKKQQEDFSSFEVYSDEDLLTYEPVKEAWLIENQIPKSEIGLLVGKRQDRKTFTALYQAICLSAGITCLDDIVPEPKKILFIDIENGKDEIKKRTYLLKKALRIEKQGLNIKYLNYPYLRLDKEPSDEYVDREAGTNFYNFKKLIEDFRPDLIIVDCLGRIVSFDLDKDNQSISNFFTGVIRQFTKIYGCSWLFIHHLRKSQASNYKPVDALDEVRGGSELVNYCRFILGCEKPKYQNDSEKELIIFKVLKMSNSIIPPAKVISFSSEDGGLKVSYEGEPQDILKGEQLCANAIKNWLFTEGIRGEFKTKQIQEASEKIGFKKTLIGGALKSLIQEGFLKRIKWGTYKISDNQEQEKLEFGK